MQFLWVEFLLIMVREMATESYIKRKPAFSDGNPFVVVDIV